MKKNTYNLTLQEVFRQYRTSADGLSKEQAEERLRSYGRNEIRKERDYKWVRLLLSQFKDALVWILLVATALAFAFREYRDVLIILIIVLVNAAIGFFQEFRAEKILSSIKKLTTDTTIAFRDGRKKEINARDLVPGDAIYVASGDNVSADGYIIESYDLKVNSFIFTGESKPETKSAKIIVGTSVPLADIDNMLFSGETIVNGEATFVVTATGMATELGKIAHMTQKVRESMTPLQKQMTRLGKNVTIISLCIGGIVVAIGQALDMSLYENFLFALALAVSVVPEGLPAAISVALSLGMKRLLRYNVLAKKLNAVETLGSVSIICTDKTGTITKNELTVTKMVVNGKVIGVSGVGYEPKGSFFYNGQEINPNEVENLGLLCKIGFLCNDASIVSKEGKYTVVGDPTEGAIIAAAKKYNHEEHFFDAGEHKVGKVPFSSERMRMSVVYRNGKTVSYVKGSPDVLLKLCSHKKIGGSITKFTEQEKLDTIAIYNSMSSDALRVLAFAYRDLDKDSLVRYHEESERDLVWVGMMAMIDPPREDVARAIAECKDLGIQVIMITGDYETTASAIAKNIRLIEPNEPHEVIHGKMLDGLSDKEIFSRIKGKNVVFARIAPEQKLRIAEILKKNGEVIAMTGDGVNDAPALKRADIGVAMGIIGTDVSKEASDMILLDDNFASIVRGIKMGRTIFQNIKKFVHYVFTSNGSELFTVIYGVLLHIPAPLTAIQILITDLGTDLFPSFSLGLEPSEPRSEESKKKMNSRERVVTLEGLKRIIYMGCIMSTGAVAAFLWSMFRGGWKFGAPVDINTMLYIQSTTATYAVISMTQMANLLQSRSERFSPFRLGFFRNRYALWAIGISVAMLLSFMYIPFFQSALRLSPIVWQDWMVVAVTTGAVFLFEEWRKRKAR